MVNVNFSTSHLLLPINFNSPFYISAFIQVKNNTFDTQMLPLFNKLMNVNEHDSIDVVGEIHSTPDNYASFVKAFAKTIVPERKLKKTLLSLDQDLSTTFTNHDEALLLVTLDNNLMKWNAELQAKLQVCEQNADAIASIKFSDLSAEQKSNIPKSKYTMGKKYGRSNIRGGWSREGVKAFTSILEKVIMFRQKNSFLDYIENLETIYDLDNISPTKRRRLQCDFDEEKEQDDDDLDELVNSYFDKYVEL